MKKTQYIIYFILFVIYSLPTYSQIKDTICIDNIQYEIIIDTITHKVKCIQIIKEKKIIEDIYFGASYSFDNINFKPEIICDVSEYGKMSLGYDIKAKALTLGAYVSIAKIYRRRSCIPTNVIYF